MLKLLHAIILSVRQSTADKIIACNYCTWNRTFSDASHILTLSMSIRYLRAPVPHSWRRQWI